MIHAAAVESRRTGPPIRMIALFGIALSQVPLWYAPGAARFVVLWLVSIGLSLVCVRLVPPPRRWLVGLGSLVSFLSVLSVDVRQKVLGYGELEKVWFVIVPLLGVVLVQIYLLLIRRAVPGSFTHQDSSALAALPGDPDHAARARRGALLCLHGSRV